jgi:hypothetical protein
MRVRPLLSNSTSYRKRLEIISIVSRNFRRPLSGDNFHARRKTKFAKQLLTIFPGQGERTNIR